MPRNKGFTLVELLAVIVVLAVILTIAVPNIIKIIDKTRIDAYVKNEEVMVKAARMYLVNNTSLLPNNIGDTTEITLDDLKNSKLIDSIKDPKDKDDCNGYILVTKIGEDEYDYSPHLNCEGDIGSSTEDGLVGYWKLDGNALDYSLNNNHGTIYSAIPTANRFGMLGTALEFNGIDAYVQLVANSELLLGANPNEWSYSFWFKKGPNSTKRVFISNYDSDNSDSLIGIWAGVNASSGSGRVFINVRGSGAPDYMHAPAGYNYNDNLWHQMVVSVKKGEFVRGYVDGIQFANSSIGTADYIDNAPIRIGALRYYDDFLEFLDGCVDEVRIYNRALSNEEIIYNYDVGKYREQ